MNGWIALVPLKLDKDAKSRLSLVLSPEQRTVLAENLARHVVQVLQMCPQIDTIQVLAPARPEWWNGPWIPDMRRGLNEEISHWYSSRAKAPALVIFADLPFLQPNDISALLDAASNDGAALATDRSGQGTNAIAIADDRHFVFCFGPDSRRRHTEFNQGLSVNAIFGLETDIDTPEDLEFVKANNWCIAK